MQKIVDIAVGIPRYSYPMYQNAPRPTENPFAAIRIMGSRSPCYDELTTYEKDGELIQRTEGNREIMVDVLFNRAGGYSDIIKFDNSFFRPDVEAICDEVGMHLLRKKATNLRNKSLETNWEIRTGITCIMSVLQVDEVVIGYVDEFNISGSHFEESGKVTNLNINIKE
ncbi:MAG: hypothetical protein HRT61_00495 [Ekhidna sp.]|nr:hypothetical protein [Ekhidna sp.]